MDFTKVECISSICVGKKVIMDGAGGSFGGRITIAKLRCPECGTAIMIVPMIKQYEYGITASTKEERIKEKLEAVHNQHEIDSKLELAEKIIRNREIYGGLDYTQAQVEQVLDTYYDDDTFLKVRRTFIRELQKLKRNEANADHSG